MKKLFKFTTTLTVLPIVMILFTIIITLDLVLDLCGSDYDIVAKFREFIEPWQDW